MNPDYHFRLFIAGHTHTARRATEHLRSYAQLLEDQGIKVCIEVVDILDDLQVAEDERILVTPVLVRKTPQPELRVVGDLSLKDRLFSALELPV
ncbi:circadian clock KaiB family protein [Ectothiorhodospira lacustris]|uniref:circadian clock KaiB family protein n=1 Tax=Ectothiorhodospira lacustris TaxID=2899127 RepID=UPI001EE7A7AB|nr:circadian clock KaiB family protein [Ectothiorhodospira lacustris]MCG5499369.1 circadian clock protein KaiB [Ectothiorhodospira lacustris]MCG5509258.1 circadian clock protein KaiB [Ectothiorhodospira lacustris]MCG5521048.1 circadian clock protein KaiB [Ectothiorhodospira lacustris]